MILQRSLFVMIQGNKLNETIIGDILIRGRNVTRVITGMKKHTKRFTKMGGYIREI